MIFVFGDCEVDADRREVRRAGMPAHVGPQVFDLLVHLIRHRDRVVVKDELIQTVWGGRVASDDTLTRHRGRQWHCRTILFFNPDCVSPPQAMQWPGGWSRQRRLWRDCEK
jgi:hypothetical protein